MKLTNLFFASSALACPNSGSGCNLTPAYDLENFVTSGVEFDLLMDSGKHQKTVFRPF